LIFGVVGAIFLAVAGTWVLNRYPRQAGTPSNVLPVIVDSTPPPVKSTPIPVATPVPTGPAEVMLLLDASGSMLGEDFEVDGVGTSRFEVLKRAAAEFIKSHPQERIGALAFAGSPFVLSGPTTDHTKLLATLEKLEAKKLGADGVAIGSAIAAGYAQLATDGEKRRMMILVTQGVNNAGFIGPLTAAEFAGNQKIPILAIGLGRNGMAPFPTTDAAGKKSYTSVKVTVDEAALKHLADISAGEYAAAPNTRALTEALANYEALKAKCPTNTFTATHADRFAAYVGTASILNGALVLRGLPDPPALREMLPKVGDAKASLPKPVVAPPMPSRNRPATPPPIDDNVSGPSITASVSKPEVHMGEPVEFILKARDLPDFPAPNTITADGLQATYASSARSTAIRSGKTTSTLEYHYELRPAGVGTLFIPAQTIAVGQQTFQTHPVQLIVRAAIPGDTSYEATPFAQIVPSSATAKVGESIPVEIRIGVDRNTTWRPEVVPVFVPEGWLRANMQTPSDMTTNYLGRDYHVLTYPTKVTPLKSGTLTLGPAKIFYLVLKPHAPVDAFANFPDIFRDVFTGPTETRSVEAPAVSVDVQP
jgi:hypothetical protein